MSGIKEIPQEDDENILVFKGEWVQVSCMKVVNLWVNGSTVYVKLLNRPTRYIMEEEIEMKPKERAVAGAIQPDVADTVPSCSDISLSA
jgi:hypothetical protein